MCQPGEIRAALAQIIILPLNANSLLPLVDSGSIDTKIGQNRISIYCLDKLGVSVMVSPHKILKPKDLLFDISSLAWLIFL